VVLTESSFRYAIISPAGAGGLMQIMPATFEWIANNRRIEHNPDDVFVPRVNIDFGTFYLRRLYNHFGDWEHAIIAYNAGMGNVGRWLQDPELVDEYGRIIHELIPFGETRNYIGRVNRAWERYREILAEANE
ncbi:MAG: lytic transglycosylase domain-containing protein, partial [Oscillospiraceae bacterium]|nr:lytic transglycosylase domain-containing protein [Oscillospiraceae bacterium]